MIFFNRNEMQPVQQALHFYRYLAAGNIVEVFNHLTPSWGLRIDNKTRGEIMAQLAEIQSIGVVPHYQDVILLNQIQNKMDLAKLAGKFPVTTHFSREEIAILYTALASFAGVIFADFTKLQRIIEGYCLDHQTTAQEQVFIRDRLQLIVDARSSNSTFTIATRYL